MKHIAEQCTFNFDKQFDGSPQKTVKEIIPIMREKSQNQSTNGIAEDEPIYSLKWSGQFVYPNVRL